MEIEFNVRGNLKQLEAVKAWCNDSVFDIVYGGSKGSGKSFLGCSLLCADALIYAGTHYFIARKKLNDIRKYTVPSIVEALEKMGVDERYYRFNGQDNVFIFHNGSKIFLIEAKFLPSDPLYYRFGSMQMTRGMLEEAGELDEDAKNNLSATVGRWKNDVYEIVGKIIQTCNPSKNYLYKGYYKKNKEGDLESWKKFIQALPSDNKMLPEGYIENLNRVLSNNQKERLLKGNWEYDDDPTTLCGYDDILSVFKNDHVSGGEKYITADIARMGSDKAIIAVWDDWVIIEFVIFDVSKMTEIQNAILSLRLKYKIPKNNCIADEDGVGGGVVDNCGILGFTNNAKPLEIKISHKKETPNYFNLQSQCCYGLADKINSFEINIIADISNKHKEEIIEELEQLKTFNQGDDKKLRILPKEQIKQNIGRSPDWRDVLMMRKYFDLKIKSKAPTSRYRR